MYRIFLCWKQNSWKTGTENGSLLSLISKQWTVINVCWFSKRAHLCEISLPAEKIVGSGPQRFGICRHSALFVDSCYVEMSSVPQENIIWHSFLHLCRLTWSAGLDGRNGGGQVLPTAAVHGGLAAPQVVGPVHTCVHYVCTVCTVCSEYQWWSGNPVARSQQIF
jgi:hypothetical protein